jgi:hypothetical protein
MKSLTREAFHARPMDMVAFYDAMPNDGLILEGACPLNPEELTEALHRLKSMDVLQADIALLDDITMYLITQRVDASLHGLLDVVAQAARLGFVSLIQGEKSNRPLRMRLVHLNFAILTVLDAGISTWEAEDFVLPFRAPWDFLRMPHVTVWITSDDDNVIIQLGETSHIMRLGLPTQVDALDECSISIGTVYDNGLWLWDGFEAQHVAHARPLLVAWQHDGNGYVIDSEGFIFALSEKRIVGAQVAVVPINQISKCRKIENKLFLFDWTDAFVFSVVDLADYSCKLIAVPEVAVVNDVVQVGAFFYLADKLQGMVFKYDVNFIFCGKALAFGCKHGQLIDPISLRYDEGMLCVLSWITHKVTRLPVF